MPERETLMWSKWAYLELKCSEEYKIKQGKKKEVTQHALLIVLRMG